MVMKPTGEYNAACKHEWRMLSQEDRERYGTAIAKCLEKWRECRKCGQVKHVGHSLPECADTFQQTKGRQYTGKSHPPLPELTPLSELDLDEVLGEGRR